MDEEVDCCTGCSTVLKLLYACWAWLICSFFRWSSFTAAKIFMNSFLFLSATGSLNGYCSSGFAEWGELGLDLPKFWNMLSRRAFCERMFSITRSCSTRLFFL